MPTKKESSDMNSADSPRNETTRLRALATGLRLRTTAAPKITVSAAKIQKRKADISQATDEHRSNHRCKSESKNPCLSVLIRVNPWLLLFLIPFEHHPVHYSGVRSVILNEVKDHSSENSGSWTLNSFVRSLAFARDDRDYFFSFHLSTTPCITPPISRSFSL